MQLNSTFHSQNGQYNTLPSSHSNMHSCHVNVSMFDRSGCTGRKAHWSHCRHILVLRSPQMWRLRRHYRGKQVRRTNGAYRANGRRSGTIMNGRICSHCVKHPHFSHPVSCSFTFQPHTHTPVSLTPLYPCSSLSHFPPQPCLIPAGSWRSLVLGGWGRYSGSNPWESHIASDFIAFTFSL